MPQRKLRWGILGGGIIATDYIAPAISKSKNAELTAVYSRSGHKAESFAKKFHLEHCYHDKTEFLKSPHFDIVYICSPNAHHYEDSVAAAKENKHVFCEKPMATTMQEALEIKKTCKDSKVEFGLGFMFPFHPLTTLAKQWIQRKKVGKITLAKANFLFELPECEKINPWRYDPTLSGGGAIIEVGCHCVNILQYLLEKEVKSIFAEMDQPRFQAPSESLGIMTLKYDDGILGIITVGNNIPATGSYGMNFEIHGSNGSIIGLGNLNRNAAGKLIYRDKTGSEEAIFLPEKEHLLLYVKEIEQFTEHVSKSVKSNSEYIFGLEQGINNMKVITSAYLSAEQNRAILL